MANRVSSLNDLFNEMYGVPLHKKYWSVDKWAKHNNITTEDLLLYENARLASSPLYEAMQEGEITKSDQTKGLISEPVPDGVKLMNLVKFK